MHKKKGYLCEQSNGGPANISGCNALIGEILTCPLKLRLRQEGERRARCGHAAEAWEEGCQLLPVPDADAQLRMRCGQGTRFRKGRST